MADAAVGTRQLRLRPRPATTTGDASLHAVSRSTARVTKAKEATQQRRVIKRDTLSLTPGLAADLVPADKSLSADGRRRKRHVPSATAESVSPPSALDKMCTISGHNAPMVTPPADPKTAATSKHGSFAPCRCMPSGTCGSSPDSGLSFGSDDAVESPYMANGLRTREQEIYMPDKDRFQGWWEYLTVREQEMPISCFYLRNHPTLQERMRTILIEWMMEVCEEYKLHRETLHIAIHYVDRYLTVSSQCTKSALQLIGVAALFIASKLEEIYPPKLDEFAFVTDGACTKKEILKMETNMMAHLNWQLTPITPNAWVSFYMQLTAAVTWPAGIEFLCTRCAFDRSLFVQILQLIDLCVLDMQVTRFLPSAIAASAMRLAYPPFANTEMIHAITGYSIDNLSECIEWMRPFAAAVGRLRFTVVEPRSKVPADDCHNIQTFAPDLATTVYNIASAANTNEVLCQQIRTYGLTHL